MPTYVLVHGCFHDGSSWARVIERLEWHGVRAFGPTVAGHGFGVPKDVSHAESTRSVVEFIMDNGLTDIVLVGHSYGATIISKVVEAIPEHIRRLVFWSGLIANDGESVMDLFPPSQRELFTRLAAESTDNTLSLPFDIWRDVFINDADIELAHWAYDQLSPEPFQQLVEQLDLQKFYSLPKPRSFLIGTEDTVLPPGPWGWHPRLSSRLGQHRLVQMPGSHEVVFSNPNGLADNIIAAGRD
jgi:pimeloyl-ACP methyl ester carboxylesterase